MTIAFGLLTYSRIPQIERLARTLARGSPGSPIAVGHVGDDAERNRLRGAEGVDVVLAAAGGRGRFGTVDTLISVMRWLERQPRTYDWLAVMSGQDYPIRPLHELEAELANAEVDGFFHHFDARNPSESGGPPMCWAADEAASRYDFQYANLTPTSTMLQRALLRLPRQLSERTRNYRLHAAYGIMVGRRAAVTPFGPDFKLYGGNSWLLINRKAVLAALEFFDTRPDVVQYFRNVIVPDEVFLPSILCNDPALRISRRELKYFDFRGGRLGHPQVFGLSDLERLEASGCYLARKFDPERDPGILDALDQRIGLGASSSKAPDGSRTSAVAAE